MTAIQKSWSHMPSASYSHTSTEWIYLSSPCFEKMWSNYKTQKWERLNTMPHGIALCFETLATSTTSYLCAPYVLTMLSFHHYYCCRAPINWQRDSKLKQIYIISLLHLSRLMCVYCWDAKTDVVGGFPMAGVGKLPVPQQSHFTPLTCTGLIPVQACNCRMSTCDIIW